MKSVNYKMGAIKRKFGTGKNDQEPGTFIDMANQNKSSIIRTNKPISKEKLSIMGLV